MTERTILSKQDFVEDMLRGPLNRLFCALETVQDVLEGAPIQVRLTERGEIAWVDADGVPRCSEHEFTELTVRFRPDRQWLGEHAGYLVDGQVMSVWDEGMFAEVGIKKEV